MFNNVKKGLRYVPYIATPVLWYQVGTYNRNDIRDKMYNKGYNLSQQFKEYPAWDNYAEPLIIKQFSIMFTGGNAFIKGMLSDNDNKVNVNKILNEFETTVSNEFEINKSKECPKECSK
jgi:hypothetical protein